MKYQKEIKALRYIAYVGMIVVAFLFYIFAPRFGVQIVARDENYVPGLYYWSIVIIILGTMIIYGIYLLTKMLKQVEQGKIFCKENSTLLRKIDRMILTALVLSIGANVISFFTPYNHPSFVMLWLAGITALVILHLICRPLYLIVEQSTEMSIDWELTI